MAGTGASWNSKLNKDKYNKIIKLSGVTQDVLNVFDSLPKLIEKWKKNI